MLKYVFIGLGLLLSFLSNAQYLPVPYTSLPNTHNFVKSYIVLKPGLTPSDVLTSTDPREVQLSTQYLDGLGRPLQTVVRKGSFNTAIDGATPKDLVQLHTYDEFGREVYQFLPYAHSVSSDGQFKGIAISDPSGIYKNDPTYSPFAQQRDFYQTGNPFSPIAAGQNETFFYSKTIFEPSPLNRVTEQYAPGNSWVGSELNEKRSIKNGYFFNTATDAVRIWNVTDDATLGNFDSYSSSAGIYADGQLYKTITTDEHGKQVIEFKDKQGQVILKKVQLTAGIDNKGTGAGYDGWICTYYIYDDFGSLRCVVQPEGVKWLSNNNWTFNHTDGPKILAEQCFRYEYDARRRIIMKKVPGAEVVYMVYDSRDRLVATNDGVGRTGQYTGYCYWLFTLYDGLNRPVVSGEMHTCLSWDALQTHMNTRTNQDYTITLQPHTNETVVVNNPILGNEAIMSNTVLSNWYANTITYYDGYDALNNIPGHGLSATFEAEPGISTSENNTDYPYVRAMAKSDAIKGLVSITRTRLLNTSYWITNVVLYDNDGRAIQTKSYNPWIQSTERTTTQYGFAGQVHRTATRQILAGSGQTTILHSLHEYDEIGRVKTIKKQHSHSSVNSGNLSAEKVIAQMNYDALGQLKGKNIGQKAGGSPLETLSYDYNIRGWLLGVNRAFLSPGVTANPGTSNWFGFELMYDKYHLSEFNGNIGVQRWRTAGDGVNRSFEYYYDAANRLSAALFYQKNAQGDWSNNEMNLSFWTDLSGAMNPDNSYDLNGNLKGFAHSGFKLGVTASSWESNLDWLIYEYFPNSNRLKKVTDGMGISTGGGDFSDQNTTGDDYTYDNNGNLIKDLNKRIGTAADPGITYNYLNLPVTVAVKTETGTEKGTITYYYDASGRKIMKKVFEKSANVFFNNQPNATEVTTETWYLGPNVFESKTYNNPALVSLQYVQRPLFFAQEEGRIRYVKAEGSQPAALHYDYMLKDHLGNVRMVLTEEEQIIRYPATTVEGSTAAGQNSLVNHESQYYKIDLSKIIPESSVTGWGTEAGTTKDYFNHNGNPPANDMYPANVTPLTTAKSSKLYRLNASANRTGLEFMIKVMAGDKIDILGKSYHANTTNVTNSNSTALTILTILTNLLASPQNLMAAKGVLPGQLNTVNTGIIPTTFIRGNNNEPTTKVPKAYINYMFFDEQFKYVSGNSSRVGANGVVKDHWQSDAQLQNINVPKNGYIFVYVSNESKFNVFFDNLQVIHKPGPLVEETHYYPFGLTMAGISSKAAGKLENKKKWNKGSELESKEFSDGSGLELYSTFYRSLDPQLGRFWQIDPKPNYMESPYAAMGNNPISYNDPLGDTLLTKADHRRAARIEKQINKTNASLNKNVTKWNGQIAAAQAKGNTNKVNSLQGKVNDANARVTSNETTLNNINAISNDQTQAYTFNQLPAGSTEGGTMLKTMSVHGSNQNVVVMNVLSDANAVHELTHAHQGAIQNMFSFNLNNAFNPVTFRGATVLAAQQVNANSEVAAYQAQYGFSPGSMPSSTVGGTPSSMNNINAFYVGGLNGTNAAGAAVPIYPNVQDMVNTIVNFFRVGF